MSQKINILMVDDTPGKLVSYGTILAELGENLIKANSGADALACLLKTDIALILMDVNMPEQNGFELAEMVRQHPRFRDVAIIFISAEHLSDSDQIKGYKHGGVDYITVPIIPELLRAKVKVFTQLHRNKLQLQILNREMGDLSSRLIRLRDEERRRLSRELHDGLGQTLIAARMSVDTILNADDLVEATQQAEQAGELIDDATKQVCSLSYLMHPPLLDEVGLKPHFTRMWKVSPNAAGSGPALRYSLRLFLVSDQIWKLRFFVLSRNR